MLFWTIGLFVILEPILGQVVEPLLYGHNTGLSPVAVIVVAAFWTWFCSVMSLHLRRNRVFFSACWRAIPTRVERSVIIP